jgi:hypothetical protein
MHILRHAVLQSAKRLVGSTQGLDGRVPLCVMEGARGSMKDEDARQQAGKGQGQIKIELLCPM